MEYIRESSKEETIGRARHTARPAKGTRGKQATIVIVFFPYNDDNCGRTFSKVKKIWRNIFVMTWI
jgi:hypothetical protein